MITKNDDLLQKKVSEVHCLLWDRFIDKQQYLIHTCLDPVTMLPDHLPTRDEVMQGIPNRCGWLTPLEDGTLNGGIYLDILLARYELTGEAGDADEAMMIFKGLCRLHTAATRKGFIPRGMLPDGTHYPNSSMDQYTLYLYGVWRYYHSPLSSSAERDDISRTVSDIMLSLEANGFNVITEDGQRGLVGNLNAVALDSSCRLLQFLLICYDLTGDEHWLDLYQAKVKEDDYARLKYCSVRPIAFPFRGDLVEYAPTPDRRQRIMNPFAMLQSQLSLLALHALEKDNTVRRIYRQGIDNLAEAAAVIISKYKEYDRDVYKKYSSDNFNFNWHPGYEAYGAADVRAQMEVWFSSRPWLMYLQHTVTEPLEAMLIILMSGNGKLLERHKGVCQEMILHYDYNLFPRATNLFPVEGIYYLGKKCGLFI